MVMIGFDGTLRNRPVDKIGGVAGVSIDIILEEIVHGSA